MRPALKHSALTLAIVTAVSLSGCKLSDLVDGDDSTSFIALQGTATNTNGPMTGARVDIKDANGNEFTAYVESDGYFALTQDSEGDEPYQPLQAPIILQVDYNESSYRSVLCNIVYSEFSQSIDTVNVHPLTEFVMNEITGTADTAYATWTSGASDDYCNSDFVEQLNNTASSLEGDSTFNFFNTLFSANNTGFDSTLRSFDSGSFTASPAASDFHLADSLGSLVLLPGTSWQATATGSFAGEVIDESADAVDIDITPEGLTNTLEDLLSNPENGDIQLQSLSISAEGNGIGELATAATVQLKGSAAFAGAAAVQYKFNVTLDLTRVEAPEE